MPKQRGARAAMVRRAADLSHNVLSVGAGNIWGAGKKGRENQSLAVSGPEFAAAPSIKPGSSAGQVIMTVRTETAEIDIYAGAGEQEMEAVLRVLKLC